MDPRARAVSLADEFDERARELSGRSAAGARRRASELRLEALLLRRSARNRRGPHRKGEPRR